MDNWTTVCRSCLSTAESFSHFIYVNITPETYWFCTSVEVKRDELPKSLCSCCYDLLKKFSDFKKTCMQSEEKLRGSLKLEKEFCPDINKEWALKYDQVHVTQVLVKQEESDDLLHDSDVNLYDNTETHDKKETCREKKAGNVKQKNLKVKRRKSKFNFSCELCSKKFVFIERFEAHKLKHEGKTESIHCKPCNKYFASWSGLHRHNEAEHSLITFKELTCKVCFKVCKTPLTLKMHCKTHEERKVQICDECGKGFISDVTLKNHLETHIKNRKSSFICEHCGKRYLSKKTRAKHVYRRHTGRRFICHYCNYPFGDKANLIKHIMIHEGKQKLYKCELCSRALTSQASLVVHMRIHTGERPFPCNYCPKSFSNKGILIDHQRIHTGEKPFKCVVCEQSFSQRGSMRRHMKVHHRLCA